MIKDLSGYLYSIGVYLILAGCFLSLVPYSVIKEYESDFNEAVLREIFY